MEKDNMYAVIEDFNLENHERIIEFGLIEKASRKIDGLTFNRIIAMGFGNLPEFQKDCVRNACIYQVEHWLTSGLDEKKLLSYSVLDVKVQYSSDKSNAEYYDFSSEGYALLEQSGLMSRRL